MMLLIRARRFILKLVYPIAKVYWRVIKPNTTGVRVVVFNKDKKVLLIKHSYRQDYFFPGGGIHKGELFKEASIRELFEETSLKLKISDLKFLGVYQFFEGGKNDVIAVYYAEHDGLDGVKVDHVEIDEYGWFAVNDLPKDLSTGVTDRLHEILSNKKCLIKRW